MSATSREGWQGRVNGQGGFGVVVVKGVDVCLGVQRRLPQGRDGRSSHLDQHTRSSSRIGLPATSHDIHSSRRGEETYDEGRDGDLGRAELPDGEHEVNVVLVRRRRQVDVGGELLLPMVSIQAESDRVQEREWREVG